MQEHKSVKWILEQLTNNKEDRKRFNSNIFGLECEEVEGRAYFRHRPLKNVFNDDWNRFDLIMQVQIIRTALSRMDNKAILSGLEGDNPLYLENVKARCKMMKEGDLDGFNFLRGLMTLQPRTISEFLYESFDEPLREGKSLGEARTALDIVMELIKII